MVNESFMPTSLKGSLQLLCIYYANLTPKLQIGVLLSSSHILHQLVTIPFGKVWDELTSCCHNFCLVIVVWLFFRSGQTYR